jgi:pimeloyl-ACP methyl ester carboxylesterase/acyl carrier protein
MATNSGPGQPDGGAGAGVGALLGEACARDLREHLVRDLGEEFGDIDLDTPLLDAGILDSIRIQGLLGHIEERFGLLLPAEAVRPESFATLRLIGQTVATCARTQAAGAAAEPLEVLNGILEGYGLRRQWVDADGSRVHVLRVAGASPPMVLLSGLGSPASSWGTLMRSLMGRREAIAIDACGFGVSAEPADGDYTVGGHVRRTAAVLDALRVTRCVLVGNSAGAMVAADLIRARPGLAGALVAISFGRVRDGGAWAQGLSLLARDADEFWARAFVNPPPLTPALRAQLERTLGSPAYAGFLDDSAIGRLDGLFAGLGVPAMFIGGLGDRIIPPEIVRAGAEQAAGRLELIPRCGHYAHAERSEEVLVCLEHFLREVAAAEAKEARRGQGA